jgi:ubiquinone/menaquinone biosynthesis C-methylase UbiE
VTARGEIHPAAAVGFERSAERYDRGRPSYPHEAVERLVDELGIGPGREVLELGAGTGKFTSLLVPSGAHLIALEPVAAMRAVLVAARPSVSAVDGTAESIPLDAASVDAVVAAQAFHWFDGDRALREIHRVLRSRGRLGLIWNVRDEAAAWARRLTEIFDRLSGPEAPRYKHMAWRAAFDHTDVFGPLHHDSMRYEHVVTRDAFLDRVLSVSYVASATEEARSAVTSEIRELLDHDPELAGRDEIAMPYVTDVYWCERRERAAPS